MNIAQRIADLRNLMQAEGLDAYLVPSSDPHNNEYVPDCWRRRAFLSGFTGSVGDVVIAADEAGLWTDGRYFLQAEDQLHGTGISLFRDRDPGVPPIEEWLAEKLTGGGVLGVDPDVVPMSVASRIERALEGKGARVTYLERNLVDAIWKDQPERASSALEIMSTEVAGRSLEGKLGLLRERMAQADCDAHLLCALDTIAWLFNLRASDVAYNRMFIAYAVVTEKKAHLFIDLPRVTAAVREHLGDSVEVHPYEALAGFLEDHAGSSGKWWIDPAFTNQGLSLKIGRQCTVYEARSPVSDLKAVKNPVEQAGFRDCHLADGIAMVRFLKWLEETVRGGEVTETSVADKLVQFRSEDPRFIEPSFATIAGYAGHGAIIHYAATPESEARLESEGIFLIDSGGHYRNGTTDITRTVALGAPTSEHREVFTRVLKGVIALSVLNFPNGASGKQLEMAARQPLWESGRDFNHGTGHGVGHCLNVHEGPVAFAFKSDVPLEPGHVLSIEPGYYEEGAYGIRLENLVIVHRDASLPARGPKPFLNFETLTLCPIDLNLIDRDLMTGPEITWLNHYHRNVFDQLSGKLDEEHREWLRHKTREI